MRPLIPGGRGFSRLLFRSWAGGEMTSRELESVATSNRYRRLAVTGPGEDACVLRVRLLGGNR